jgi:frataxin-like iron-binding protein CyaY
VLGWYELPDSDQPGREIWLNDEALDEHFTAVRARWGSNSSEEAIEDMDQNEFTKGLKKGR